MFHENRGLIVHVKAVWSPVGTKRVFSEIVLDFFGTFEPLLWSGEGTALWSGDTL